MQPINKLKKILYFLLIIMYEEKNITQENCDFFQFPNIMSIHLIKIVKEKNIKIS